MLASFLSVRLGKFSICLCLRRGKVVANLQSQQQKFWRRISAILTECGVGDLAVKDLINPKPV